MPMASHTLLGKQKPTALSNKEMVLFELHVQHRAETAEQPSELGAAERAAPSRDARQGARTALDRAARRGERTARSKRRAARCKQRATTEARYVHSAGNEQQRKR